MPAVAMQFQRVKRYAKQLDASVDGDDDARTDCAVTLPHLPDNKIIIHWLSFGN